MSALIYNPTSQAFEDAETPKIVVGGYFKMQKEKCIVAVSGRMRGEINLSHR